MRKLFLLPMEPLRLHLIGRQLLTPFLLPGGLLCAASLYLLQLPQLPEQLDPLFQVLPIAVVLIALPLGWRFNRTRLIYAVGLLTMAELLEIYLPAQRQLGELVALLVPLNLLFVSLFRERGIVSRGSLFWGLFLLLEGSVCGWLLSEKAAALSGWLNFQFVELPQVLDHFSQLQLLVYSLVLLGSFIRYLLKSAAFEASFFWAQLLLLVGFSGFGNQPLQLYYAAAGLVLILGIMESSHSLAYRDELTGLPGRRALNEALAKLGRRYVLAMLDIDHFKKFNDTHGHDVGDQVLRMIAGKLATVAGGGKVFRYGGEEFTVLFPRKSVKSALPHLEQLRSAVEEARFIPRSKDRPKSKPKNKQKPRAKSHRSALRVTISIGAAERSRELTSCDAVLKAADQALYRAKKAGRNRVVS